MIEGVIKAGADIPKEYFDAILRKACPLTGVMMEAGEIAEVVQFLASDAGECAPG